MGEWKLKNLEECLFKHFLEVNFQELFKDNENVKLNLLNKLELKKLELSTLKKTQNRIQELLIRTDLEDDNKDNFIREFNNTATDIKKLNTEILNLNNELVTENDARNLIETNELKELIYKLNNSQDNYLFRSSVNQLLSRHVEKIELQEEHFLFHPWEYNEESSEIISFRHNSKSYKELETIVSSKEFEAYCQSLMKRALIKYKTGSKRLVLLEEDYSILDNKTKLKAMRNRLNTNSLN